MRQGVPDPPEGCGGPFFEWLLAAADRLETSVASGPGLTSEEIDWLQQQFKKPLPVDFRAFYQHCTPWWIWTDPRTQWLGIRGRIYVPGYFDYWLLPIEINSQVGNVVVAAVGPDGKYKLVQTSHYQVLYEHHLSLRDWFIREVADYINSAEQP